MSAPGILGITVPPAWAWALTAGHTGGVNRLERPRDANAHVGKYLAIHAGPGDWREDEDSLGWGSAPEEKVRAYMASRGGVGVPDFLTRGAIVAVGRLQSIGTIANDERVGGLDAFQVGPVFLHVVERVDLPKPIPCASGGRGLWTLPQDVLEQVRAGWLAVDAQRRADAAAYAARAAAARLPCPCGVTSLWCPTCGRCQAVGHARCGCERRVA